ncbi:hypothetical protein MUP56_02495 [Patescibacteria group bacterium]|nr:hypothetical protein [Patescibacteria group bacterium]
MIQKIVYKGNRAVIINGDKQDGFFANLYVNARDGMIQNADITSIRWTGKTFAGAMRWANKQLNAEWPLKKVYSEEVKFKKYQTGEDPLDPRD